MSQRLGPAERRASKNVSFAIALGPVALLALSHCALDTSVSGVAPRGTTRDQVQGQGETTDAQVSASSSRPDDPTDVANGMPQNEVDAAAKDALGPHDAAVATRDASAAPDANSTQDAPTPARRGGTRARRGAA